jgi:Cdc6-like AAA superfamily ATPase
MVEIPEYVPTIQYYEYEQIVKELGRCVRATRQFKEPHCLALEGVTGAGKTHLVEQQVRDNPPFEDENGTTIPILHIKVPSIVTVYQLSRHILRVLDDPLADTLDDPNEINDRVDGLISDCVSEYVILDDIQHVLNIDTTKQRQRVSDWLKVRIKNTKKPFVIIGIEGSVEDILKENKQLSRLFASRKKIEPFPLSSTRGKAGKEDAALYLEQLSKFDFFVRRAERLVEVKLTEEIARDELLFRFHYATNGVVGNMMNLLRYAWVVADEAEKKTEIATLSILSEAYQNRMKEHLKDDPNYNYLMGKDDPFAFDPKKQFKPPKPKPPKKAS